MTIGLDARIPAARLDAADYQVEGLADGDVVRADGSIGALEAMIRAAGRIRTVLHAYAAVTGDPLTCRRPRCRTGRRHVTGEPSGPGLQSGWWKSVFLTTPRFGVRSTPRG
jgi:hypothetical protein